MDLKYKKIFQKLLEVNISILHCLVSAAGRGSFIREGVGDLQIQETGWDQADGVGLKNIS